MKRRDGGGINSSLLHESTAESAVYRAVRNGQCLVGCGVCVGVRVQGGGG